MDHRSAADVDAAVGPVGADIAGFGIGDLGPTHESFRGAQTDAVPAAQTVADEAGAVEGIGTASCPLVRLADFAVCAVNDGVARNALRLAVVDVAVVGGRLAVALDVLLCLLGERGFASSLFLGEQRGCLGAQGVVGCLHLGDHGLGLGLDGGGLLGLLCGDALLLLENGLLSFNFGAELLGLLNHFRIAVVEIVQKIPVGGEGLEVGGAEQQVEEGERAGAVHAAGARTEVFLQKENLRGCLFDFCLGFIHLGLGGFLLFNGGEVVDGCLIELLLHGVEACECSFCFGALFSGSGYGEC